MENHLGTSIKTLRTDCGSEYTNNEFCQFCSQSSIIHQFTCPHTSQQNGVAKRKHRHIVDMALTLISHSSLPFQYWTYAFSTAIFLIINHLPSLSRGSISPWETLFGTSPNFSLFKSFGCACFPLLHPYSKHKFSLRSKECVFLGYASNSKGYLCLDPLTSRTYISRNVVFNESHYPFSLNSLSCPPLSSSSNSNSWLSSLLFFHPCQTPSVLGPAPTNNFSPSPTPSVLGPAAPYHLVSPSLVSPSHLIHPLPSLLGPMPLLPEPNIIPEPISAPILTTQPEPPDNPPNPNVLSPTSSPLPILTAPVHLFPALRSHPMQTRSKSGIVKKKSFATSTTINYLQTEPPSFTIASKIPEWRVAMASEFDALQRQYTWSLIPLCSDQNLVGCCWVYKIKRNTDGSVSWYKARLVAKGFH